MEIRDIIPCKKETGNIGVEIEVEADNLPPRDLVARYWKVDADASLRGESCEFVLKKPLNTRDLDLAFEELQGAINSSGTRLRPTYRAGIHVHINVQDLSPKQLITFISSYFMLEEVLLSYCDKSRIGNHFCLRMTDASYTLDMITQAVLDSNLKLLDTEDLRYASLNITSLFKYGSIEFRALESMLDFKKIKIWAGVLQHLKEFSKKITNPTDLLNEASARGFETFARDLLGPYYEFFGRYATEEKIRVGIRNIQYAVYSRNWSEVNRNIFDKNINLFTS